MVPACFALTKKSVKSPGWKLRGVSVTPFCRADAGELEGGAEDDAAGRHAPSVNRLTRTHRESSCRIFVDFIVAVAKAFIA